MSFRDNTAHLIQSVNWRKQTVAMAAALVVLLLTLAILLVGQRIPEITEPKLEVRTLNVALPPPPPPPPQPVEQPQVDVPIDVSAPGRGAVVPKIDMPKEIVLERPDAPKITTVQPVFDNLAPDLDVFNLDELDGLPKLLTQLRITMPKSLLRRGINEVQVRLEVTIDETGRLTLNRIIENPYPELNKEIQRLIKRSRFTPPKKGNEAVRARFIWPIEIKS